MKICLVATFPPSGRQLNEYAFHMAREVQRNPDISLTILADELTDYEFSTDENGEPINAQDQPELAGFDVIRCWKFNSMATPIRLLNTIRKLKPDVVWFNLVFSSFATPDNPIAAMGGLCVPALTRACGYYTHVTLHHLIEHVDFVSAGLSQGKLFRLAGNIATKTLLKSNSVSVLLPAYRQTLAEKYGADSVLLGTHGTFTPRPSPPDFTQRGNPEHRILAIGHWGTYKRLETLMDAFPAVLKKVPHARLIVAGANHHTKAGYWEAIRESQGPGSRVQFRGYVPEADIPELFRTSTVVVMPYDSATGSSGPAHQACEYGVPIVCADLADFRDMAANEDMAISFYGRGNSADLSEKLVALLQSPAQQRRMAEHNFSAAMEMTMESVVHNYLRWFALKQCQKTVGPVPLFDWRVLWQSLFGSRTTASSVRDVLRPEVEEGAGPAAVGSRSIRSSEPQGWPRPETVNATSRADRRQSGPQLADEF